MPAPPDLSAYYSLGDLQHVLASEPGKAVNYYRVRSWLLTHGVPVQRIGRQACISRAIVDAIITTHGKGLPRVLHDAPAEQAAAPEYIPLRDVALRLFGENSDRARMRARRWLVRHGVAVWRPGKGAALVQRAQFEKALEHFGQPVIKPRSTGQQAAHEANRRKHGSLSSWGRALRKAQLEKPAAEPAPARSTSLCSAPPYEPKPSFRKPRSI